MGSELQLLGSKAFLSYGTVLVIDFLDNALFSPKLATTYMMGPTHSLMSHCLHGACFPCCFKNTGTLVCGITSVCTKHPAITLFEFKFL